MREVRWEYLRPEELLAELERCPVAYIPVGSVEWHGPHLPQGTDMLIAYEHSLRVAREVGGVVHPTIFCGTERERSPHILRNLGFEEDEWIVGMDFPKNIISSPYYPEEILALLVREVVRRLIEQGYQLIALVNGHGAENQIAVLERLAAEFSAQGEAKVMYVMGVPITYDDVGNVNTEFGHADLFETAQVLACFPDRVDLERLPPSDQPLANDSGIVDGPTWTGKPTPDFTVRPEFDPRRATPELGQRYLDDSVAGLVKQVSHVLKGLGKET